RASEGAPGGPTGAAPRSSRARGGPLRRRGRSRGSAGIRPGTRARRRPRAPREPARRLRARTGEGGRARSAWRLLRRSLRRAARRLQGWRRERGGERRPCRERFARARKGAGGRRRIPAFAGRRRPATARGSTLHRGPTLLRKLAEHLLAGLDGFALPLGARLLLVLPLLQLGKNS